jgi:hypothetical protein
MLQRMRSRWLAGVGALLLVLSMSGVAAAASVTDSTTDGSQTTAPVVVSPTLLTFEDLDGNGIDDDCETGVVAAPVAAAAALASVDANGDGTVSVSEAAHSDWVGGLNCNHGGYVSGVAGASADTCDGADTQEPTHVESNDDATDTSTTDANDQGKDESTADSSEGDTADSTGSTTVTSTVSTCTVDTSTDTTTTTPAVCPVIVAPVTPPLVDTAPSAHGTAVSSVAQSTSVGGKNCNHGGAVSEAAHALSADQAAKRAAHLSKHQGKGHGPH